MVDTLRQRQNMEILDVFKNVQRQVFDREKQQVAIFPMKNEPKTQRDLGVEVNVDKSVEQINKVLESKLGALEGLTQFLEQSIGQDKASQQAQQFQAYQAVTNTGDIIPLWNQITRYYQTIGLSRDSQSIVKVKLQELKPNLDAMLYGINGVINYIFQYKKAEDLYENKDSLKILQLLRTKSVYGLISKQLDSEPELITVPILESAYKNVFQSLSANQIELVKRFAPHQDILKQNISNIPIYTKDELGRRLKSIQDELGIKLPPDYLRKLEYLPIDKASVELDRIRQEVKKPPARERQAFNELNELINEKSDLELELDRYNTAYQALVVGTEELEKNPVDVEEYKQEEVPQAPIKPKRLYIMEKDTEEEKIQKTEDYNAKMTEYRNKKRERDAIVSKNEINKENEVKTIEQRDELIRERKQEIQDMEDMYAQITRRVSILNGRINKAKSLLDKLKINVKPVEFYTDLRSFANEEPIQFQGLGKPTKINTRGLATMKGNYGVRESESESESDEESSDGDALDYDDRRNEHYYNKPY